MRLIKKNINRDGSGSITLFPEEPEDMWHAYNLIRPNDLLRASALRRVTTESSTGSTASHRVHTTLAIRVTKVDFDTQAGELHVAGKIAEENKYVKIGQHHTLDLELQRNFTLEKAEGWDSVALEVIREATDPSAQAHVGAVVMQEGLAHICLITEHQTILRQKVEMSIPRKRQGMATSHDKGITNFFRMTLETMMRNIDLENPVPVLLGSPGFTATAFHKFILETAAQNNDKVLLANKANFIVVHTSTGHLHSLNEVLKSPEVLSRLHNTKYARETSLMDQFFTLVRTNEAKAWYGPNQVTQAVDRGAVGRGGGVLLISNKLFRSQVIGVRKRWVALVDKVKEEGGEVRILSSEHESGRRLEGLGGIAAILTYPIEDLDEDEEQDEKGPEE